MPAASEGGRPATAGLVWEPADEGPGREAAADAAGLPLCAGGGPPAGSDGRQPGGDSAGRSLSGLLGRAAVAAVVAAGVGGLFYAYLLQSRILPTDADGAGNALQAWDMLHGNVLLSGWSLSDVSFYTTELPEYMLVELVRGLNADVVHVAAAITYTLVGVLAMVLAIGRATGREAAVARWWWPRLCWRRRSARPAACCSCRPIMSAPRSRCC